MGIKKHSTHKLLSMDDNNGKDKDTSTSNNKKQVPTKKRSPSKGDSMKNPFPKGSAYKDVVRRLPKDFEPGPHDVICSRGQKARDAPGNVRFRVMIIENLEQYSVAETKQEKSTIVTGIVSAVQRNTPLAGFVRKIDDQWHVLSDHLAREKTGQYFRDTLHTQYKSSTKAKRERMAAEKRASATSSLVSETASPAASAGKATAKPSSTVVAAPSLPKFSAVSNEVLPRASSPTSMIQLRTLRVIPTSGTARKDPRRVPYGAVSMPPLEFDQRQAHHHAHDRQSPYADPPGLHPDEEEEEEDHDHKDEEEKFCGEDEQLPLDLEPLPIHNHEGAEYFGMLYHHLNPEDNFHHHGDGYDHLQHHQVYNQDLVADQLRHWRELTQDTQLFTKRRAVAIDNDEHGGDNRGVDAPEVHMDKQADGPSKDGKIKQRKKRRM